MKGIQGSEDEEKAALTSLSVRKAVISARKQMLDMILSVRVDSRQTVSAYLSEENELAERVRGLVQNSPIERPSVFNENGEVRVFEILRGKLAELILPTTIPFQSGIPPKMATSFEQDLSFQETVPEPVGTGISRYTGVIIDARGLKVTPALTPVIFGQDGVGVYGAFMVSRADAINKGVVSYVTTPNPVVLEKRVGTNPLLVPALSVYGSWRTDLVIASPMARLIKTILRSPGVLENCRVVVVLDSIEGLNVEEGVYSSDLPLEDQ
ncbi:hypothetical protein [Pseudodesulfovibrio piezophilus]|uniref:hypothetical protein n=1 Tax=Pseudodesulfovibrio piezophilus TaxID=879567 RepID=UPI0012FEDD8D|nr:hypothetical protein [Pseudodesulfovibrio piezophilus]